MAVKGLGLSVGMTINSGAANRILFEDGSNQLAESANLIFDGSNLGIGISPSEVLHVNGTIRTTLTAGNVVSTDSSQNLSDGNGVVLKMVSFRG